MARTYPVPSPFSPVAGYPWGTRTSNTGTPLVGTRQQTVLTLTGTPQDIKTEDQTVTCTGTFAAGGVATLTLDGTPYVYNVVGGDTPTDVAFELKTLAAADPNYTVTNAGPVIDILSNTPGAWAGTITCSYVPVGAEDGALVQAVVTTGADANTYAATDGTLSWSYTVAAGNTLANCATGLAALIDAEPNYVATAHGTEIWVTDGVGISFTMTDASINNQLPGGAVLAQVVTPAVAGPLKLGDPGVLRLTNVSAVALWCQRPAGTSYQVVPWVFNSNINLWHALPGTSVAAALEVILLDVSAIDAMYVELNSFVGGAEADVYVDGNRLTPGFQG